MMWLRGGLHKEVTVLPIQLPAISRWQTFLKNKNWPFLKLILPSQVPQQWGLYPILPHPPDFLLSLVQRRLPFAFAKQRGALLWTLHSSSQLNFCPEIEKQRNTSLVPCPGALRWWLLFQVLPCNDRPCPIDCRWDHWSPWSPCTGTPDTLNHERTLSKNHAAQADLARGAQGKGWKGKAGLAVKAGQLYFGNISSFSDR